MYPANETSVKSVCTTIVVENSVGTAVEGLIGELSLASENSFQSDCAFIEGPTTEISTVEHAATEGPTVEIASSTAANTVKSVCTAVPYWPRGMQHYKRATSE